MRRVRLQKQQTKSGSPRTREVAEERPRPEVRKDVARTWWPDGWPGSHSA